jgi:hypothetical protein
MYTRPQRGLSSHSISYTPSYTTFLLSLLPSPSPRATPPQHLLRLPQPLQLPHNDIIRIQEAIHTLPHTRLLVFIQLPILDIAAGYAFAEAGIG